MKTERLRELAQWIIYQRRQVVDFIDWPRNVLLWRYRLNPDFDVKYIIGPRKRINEKRAERVMEHRMKIEQEITRRHVARDNRRLELEKEIADGDYSIYGDWIVHHVDTCTCGVGGALAQPHERLCGLEPVVKLIDVLMEAQS